MSDDTGLEPHELPADGSCALDLADVGSQSREAVARRTRLPVVYVAIVEARMPSSLRQQWSALRSPKSVRRNEGAA